MKAIKTTGTVDEQRQLALDSPLTVEKQIRTTAIKLDVVRRCELCYQFSRVYHSSLQLH